uniref:Uncharacterized protein n=1 Tax=Sphaerodactylus townsendi TaxID=933632 RepID=A0ACB8FPR2_9SAUR
MDCFLKFSDQKCHGLNVTMSVYNHVLHGITVDCLILLRKVNDLSRMWIWFTKPPEVVEGPLDYSINEGGTVWKRDAPG